MRIVKSKIRPAVKYHGGKYYLASWIAGHFPKDYRDMTFVEPYCGAASVLLNKEKSATEVLNDIHPGLIALLRAIRDDCGELMKRLRRLNYAKETFEAARARKDFKDCLEVAVNEFVLRRMSRGGMKEAFAWSKRQRGGQPGDKNAWDTILKTLPDISQRIQDVYIFNKKAVDVLKAFNREDTLVMADPTYLPETRTAKKVYEYEMTTEDHIALASLLKNFKGKVILCGYPSPLYSRLYSDWRFVKKKVPNHSAQTKKKAHREEGLWMNY